MISNLKIIDDKTLLERTRQLVRNERETTTLILHHLREVERRMLFAVRGFSSLFEYCTRELGYSEAAAQRRIASMRLLRELPEIESKIRDGSLSLSVVAQAQTFFKQEAKASHDLKSEEKLAILRALEGKSARDAEKELIRRSTQTILPREHVRPIDEIHYEMKLVLTQKTLKDLESLKGLFAHAHPDASWGDLVGILAHKALKKLDPVSLPTSEVQRRTAQSGQSIH